MQTNIIKQSNREFYIDRIREAKTHKVLAENCANAAVRAIAEQLGFSNKQYWLFSAKFSQGDDAVVLFNGEGEKALFKVELMAELTKEQVIERLIDSGISKVTEQLLTE